MARTTYIHQGKTNSLVPSQRVYHNGEQAQIKLPALPTEDYTQYLAVGLPDGSLFVIKELNDFVPFDETADIPACKESSGERVIDVTVDNGIPRGDSMPLS